MDDDYKKLLQKQDWSRISLEVLHYCASFRKKFGKGQNQVIADNMLAEDLAQQAIQLVLSGRRVWQPERGDLLSFLKFSVVRSLVSNAFKAKENSLFACLDEFTQYGDIDTNNAIENVADERNNFIPELAVTSHENLSFLLRELQDVLEKFTTDGAKEVFDCFLNGIVKPREIEELTGVPSSKVSEIKRQIKNKLKLKGFGNEQ